MEGYPEKGVASTAGAVAKAMHVGTPKLESAKNSASLRSDSESLRHFAIVSIIHLPARIGISRPPSRESDTSLRFSYRAVNRHHTPLLSPSSGALYSRTV